MVCLLLITYQAFFFVSLPCCLSHYLSSQTKAGAMLVTTKSSIITQATSQIGRSTHHGLRIWMQWRFASIWMEYFLKRKMHTCASSKAITIRACVYLKSILHCRPQRTLFSFTVFMRVRACARQREVLSSPAVRQTANASLVQKDVGKRP